MVPGHTASTPVNSVNAFFDAVGVFLEHLADVHLLPLFGAIVLQVLNLLLRTVAWQAILSAAYPGSNLRWRSSAGAYLSGVGVNAIAPARSGDLVRLYLLRSRLPESTTPTIIATLLVETLVDFVLATLMFGYALTQHVLPRIPDLPSLPAFEWSWLIEHRVPTAIVGASIGLALILLGNRALHAGRRFKRRVALGFVILKTPRRYLVSVVIPQVAAWVCRFGVAWLTLEAFGLQGSFRNAAIVLVVGALATLLPLTPGGVGTQQVILVAALSGVASSSQIIGFSVGSQATITLVNAGIGLVVFGSMARTLSPKALVARLRLEHGH